MLTCSIFSVLIRSSPVAQMSAYFVPLASSGHVSDFLEAGFAVESRHHLLFSVANLPLSTDTVLKMLLLADEGNASSDQNFWP